MVFKLPKLFSSYTDWLEKQQSTILSAAAVIAVASIVSALSGILKTRLLNYYFLGPTQARALVAYNVASQIPDTMFQLIILGALSAAFIPIFSQYKQKSEEEAFRMTSIMMNTLLLLFLVIGVIVFIFADPLTRFATGSGFTEDQVIIAANLTRIMLGAQFFFGISNFLTGILQSYRKFIVPAFAPIVYNLGIALGVFLFAGRFGIYSAGIGVVIGAFLHMLIQFPSVYKLGFRYKLTLNFNHPGLKSMTKLMPARTVTLGINQLQDLFDNFFATSIVNNPLSELIFQYASTLMALPIRFFGTPIGQAALPFLVAEAEGPGKDGSTFRDLVLKSIHQISFFAFPASALLLILRVPIIRLAYGTPNFTWATTIQTGQVVAVIAVSIAAQAIVQLLIRAFYALKNTKTPFYITIVVVLLYLILDWFFIFVMKTGVIGMAYSVTITTVLEMLLSMYFLNRKIKGLLGKSFWIPQIKMVTASFFMAVFTYLPFRILDRLVFNTDRTVELFLLTVITATIGMLVYIYFSALFDVRELAIVEDIVNKIGSWQKTLSRTQEVLLEHGVSDDEL